MIANVFFLGLEIFTVAYSQIPGHVHSFQYLYYGLHGHSSLAFLMRFSLILGLFAIFLLILPISRQNNGMLVFACASVFISLWIDKGFGLVVGGFVPNPFEKVTEYWPTLPEALIALGVWAIGFLILTILYKVAVSVKEETAS